jgi:Zn-dependent protease/CBS domain-containing protein
MEAQIKLGRMFGIAIGLHYSWFIIAFLITLSLATHFGMAHPGWTAAVVWLSAALTGLLFFVGLLLHEMAHALTARARDLPVAGITLFALGGVSLIERESQDAKSEFLIGIVGPLTSALVGAGCLGIAYTLGWSAQAGPATPAESVLVWLGYINFALAVFNMIPGFPLDGGRVLRSIVWGVTGDPSRATRIAARGGQVVGFLFIVYGLTQFLGGAGVGGLWLVLIGWFLLGAAGSSVGRLKAMDMLRDLRAGDLMTRECGLVESRTSVADFVSGSLLRTGRRCFLVSDDGGVSGLITLGDLESLPREEWERTPLERVMRPLGDMRSVSPETPASEVFEAMTSQDVHQVPVVARGRLEGVVSRGDLMRALEVAGLRNP